MKVRSHSQFARAIRAVREKHQYAEEFHFCAVMPRHVPVYRDLIDAVAATDVTWAACVVDRTVDDPCRVWPQSWVAEATVVAQLLCGCLHKRELTSLSMDQIGTPPPDVATEDVVRKLVNRQLARMAVVTAATLDSSSSDGLQVADLIASAVAFETRRRAGIGGSSKAKARVAEHFGRSKRTKVAQYLTPAR